MPSIQRYYDKKRMAQFLIKSAASKIYRQDTNFQPSKWI